MTGNVVRAQLGAVLILAAVYCLQVATPLRLHPDTVVLLSVAETVEHGGGYLYHGKPTVFPPGYPMVLALLIRAHLARVWIIVGLNIAFLAIGLLAAWHIFRSEGYSASIALGVCSLSLLSFVFIKYSVIPLTDVFFFCISMCGLASMQKAAASPFRWRRLTGSVALVVASVCIRRIGVALLPALLYSVVVQSDVRLYVRRLSSRMKVAIVFVAVSGVVSLGAIAVVWGARTASTLLDLGALLKGHALIASVLGIMSFRFKELGEIALNLPYPALPRAVQDAIPAIGAAALLLIGAGVVARKHFGIVETYFISYAAVILVWPFYDPRFWLPVIPFLIAYSLVALRRLMRRRIVTHIVEAYAMMFVLMGILTLASNTRLSYSGGEFGDLYTEGRYHSTYCAVWRCKGADGATIDAEGLHLLRYYKQNQAAGDR